jgi:hypothetical protein
VTNGDFGAGMVTLPEPAPVVDDPVVYGELIFDIHPLFDG